MKVSLQPGEYFPIVRQLADHTDLTTYYVRAVIRNPLTDTTLLTVNLADKTGGRFKVSYQVPADVSGLGFFIDITTSVYTDSGYTTKASNYGDESETYLVMDRMKSSGGGGSGGGGWGKGDWEKLKKFLEKLVKDFPKTEMEPVMAMLEGIKKDVQEIELELDMEPPEKLDLSPVLTSIKNSTDKITKAIEDKEVTRETDIVPVLEAIAESATDLSNVEETMEEIKDILETHVDDFGEKYEEGTVAKEKLTQMKELLGGEISLKSKKEEKKEEAPTRGKRLVALIPK